MSREPFNRRQASEDGFTLVEMLVALTILLVVCGTVMRGVLGLTDVSRMVSNRTDMHNGVRNATELLTQEVGQAGRISLPGVVTLAGGVAAGSTTLTVASTADGDSTAGMFVGEQLLIGTSTEQETVTVSAAAGSTVTLVTPLENTHPANAPVQAVGGFREGVVPPAAAGYANGSTPTVLKIFGDIHDDGRLVYVEYTCDMALGRLYRNSMAYNAGAKTAPTVEEILIDNIDDNPPNANGTVTPCFTYDTQTVLGKLYVIDVAITLTIQSRHLDKNTGDFQKETKALLNVSPRNVFNVWQNASLNITNRIQPIPAEVTQLLPTQTITVITTPLLEMY